MLVSPSLSASGKDVPHVQCPVLYRDVAFYSKCQSVMYEKKKATAHLACASHVQLCGGGWKSLWLPTGSQSRSQKLHAEQSLFTCLPEPRVAEERLWDHQVSQKDKLIHSSPQSGSGSWKQFWSLTCVLFLSSLLSDFGCIHSFGEEAQIIFSFILSDRVHRGAFHSACITEGETGKFLPSPLPAGWLLRNLRYVSFGYICWSSSKVGLDFLLDLPVLAWHRQAGCFVTYVYYHGDWEPMAWTRNLLCYAMNPTKRGSLHSVFSPILLLPLQSPKRSQSYLTIHIQYLLENSQLPQY